MSGAEFAEILRSAEPGARSGLIDGLFAATADLDGRARATALAELAKMRRRTVDLGDEVSERLAELSQLLNRQRAAEAVRSQREADERARPALRAAVLTAFAQPYTCREVAVQVGVHPSHVAREIAALLEAGELSAVIGTADRRCWVAVQLTGV